MQPDKKITDFIKKHHVLTLATCVDNKPYCSNCFYAFNIEDNVLIFSSPLETKHAKQALENSFVAGAIVLETKIVGKIQGLQFNGIMSIIDESKLEKYKNTYLKKFPFAVIMLSEMWVIELNYIKLTDNTLGFGKKLIWEK